MLNTKTIKDKPTFRPNKRSPALKKQGITRFFEPIFSKSRIGCFLLLAIVAICMWGYGQSRKKVLLNNELFHAVQDNDKHRVLTLLAEGANPNAKYDPDTPQGNLLHVLGQSFQRLFDRSQETERIRENRRRENHPPLVLLATMEKDLKKSDDTIILRLIEAGADINAQDNYDNTALIWASGTGQLDVVKHLLQNGARCDIQNYNGDTALAWAAANGRAAIVKLLLSKGANLNLIVASFKPVTQVVVPMLVEKRTGKGCFRQMCLERLG